MHEEDKRKHLLWITPGFAANEGDTVCIPTLQGLAMELSPVFRISIFAMDYPFSRGPYEWNGLKVYSAGAGNRTLAKLGMESQLRNWLGDVGAPDLVHSFWWGPAAWLGNRLSKRIRIPHVCTLMGQDVLTSNRYLKLLNLKRATHVAISPRQAELFTQNAGKQPDAIHPFGLEDHLRLPLLPDQPRDIDILGMGGFSPVKNHSRFVEVVAELVPHFPNLKVVLAGDGSQRALLEGLIESHGLQGTIHLTGLVPRPEALALMQRSKVFLHTSTYESLGLVFNEALSRGALVVSLAVGGAIPHPRWKICPSEADLSAAVRDWLEHPLQPEPVWLGGMKDTAIGYHALYAKLMAAMKP